jgi:hypothetical protein
VGLWVRAPEIGIPERRLFDAAANGFDGGLQRVH